MSRALALALLLLAACAPAPVAPASPLSPVPQAAPRGGYPDAPAPVSPLFLPLVGDAG